MSYAANIDSVYIWTLYASSVSDYVAKTHKNLAINAPKMHFNRWSEMLLSPVNPFKTHLTTQTSPTAVTVHPAALLMEEKVLQDFRTFWINL